MESRFLTPEGLKRHRRSSRKIHGPEGFPMKLIRSATFDIAKGVHQNNELVSKVTIHTGQPYIPCWVWLALNASGVIDTVNLSALSTLAIQVPEFSDDKKGNGLLPCGNATGQFVNVPVLVLTDANGDVSLNAAVNQNTPTPAPPDYWVVAQDVSGLFVSRQLTTNDFQA